MRKFRVTFAFVVLAYSFSIVQAQENGLKNAEMNYLVALNHQNSGVVESAIVNSMILKLYYPDKNYNKIIKEMKRLGWNQITLAEKMGVHRGQISAVLKNKPDNLTLYTINKYATALDVDAKDLLI